MCFLRFAISLSLVSMRDLICSPSLGFELRATIFSSISFIITYLSLVVHFSAFNGSPTLLSAYFNLVFILVALTTSSHIISLAYLKKPTFSRMPNWLQFMMWYFSLYSLSLVGKGTFSSTTAYLNLLSMWSTNDNNIFWEGVVYFLSSFMDWKLFFYLSIYRLQIYLH